MNGRIYGNNSTGFGYSPDRSRDVDHYNNNRSQLLGASGSRQGGYYYSAATYSNKPKATGRYLGNGQYIED